VTEKARGIERTDLGRFEKGKSGNPLGRPKGSKNKITLLKQSLEVALREQAAPHMEQVLDKAIEMAVEGDRTMIKLLLEQHMSKGTSDDVKASEKVAIQINAGAAPEIKEIKEQPIIDSGETENE
jgi:hypothetical protein